MTSHTHTQRECVSGNDVTQVTNTHTINVHVHVQPSIVISSIMLLLHVNLIII